MSSDLIYYFNELTELLNDYINYEVSKDYAKDKIKDLERLAKENGIEVNFGTDILENMEQDSSYESDLEDSYEF